MYGKFHIFFLVILSLRLGTITSQIPGKETVQFEELLYQDETSEVPVEIFERLNDQSKQLINLNQASKEELGASGLFTPFQIHMFMEYRQKYGSLFSIYELAGLSGFRADRLREIAPYLTVEAENTLGNPARNKDLIMMNSGLVLPLSVGYGAENSSGTGPVYHASPMKTRIRIRVSNKQNLLLGVAYDKDAGERFFQQHKPEFISGYMEYRGSRLIKQLVVGNFRLQQGLGLVNGTGFMQSPEAYRLKPVSLAKLDHYASVTESGFRNGVACRIHFKPLKLILWSSYRKIDLQTGKLPDTLQDIDWAEYQRKTGMHRTTGEIAGRSLAFRFNTGIHLSIHHRNLGMGMIFENEINGLTPKGMDSLTTGTNNSEQQAFSLHWKWNSLRLGSFGELAGSIHGSTALLCGVRYYFNDFIQGLLLLHQYGAAYRGMNSSAYASGSNLSNEKGIALQLHAEPGKSLITDFKAELFRYPESRHLTTGPSMGYKYALSLYNSNNAKLHWKLRAVKKLWQTTPAGDFPGFRSLQTNQQTRIDLRIEYDPGASFYWQSRYVVSFSDGIPNQGPAHAALQKVSISPSGNMKCILQFLVFHVPDWKNRIYLYEPGFYYDFNFPVYYGTGQKISTVITLKASRKLIFAGKISLTVYDRVDYLGSGNDRISGNRKLELGIQVRRSL